MKNYFILYILSFCFLSNISWGQNILEEKLIYRGNLAFHQESDEPVTGIVISKYETGETKEKGENVDGMREFEWKEFHQNGTVKSTINYKNGFKEGPFEIYFEDGKIKALGNYIKGLEDGNWHEFTFNWNAASKRLSVTFKGETIITYDVDIVKDVFSGTTTAYFGFTSDTDDDDNYNEHRVYVKNFCNRYV